MIGDVLKQMNLTQTTNENAQISANSPPKFSHNILQLFQFPSLQAVLHTHQQNKAFDDREIRKNKKRPKKPLLTLDEKLIKNDDEVDSEDEDFVKLNENVIQTVFSSFVCDFSSAVGVQTDFNAQVSFLPELLKSYISSHHVRFN